MTRKIEIDHETASKVCGYIRMGAGIETAMIAAGFLSEELRDVFKELESKSGPWKSFADDIKKAMAHFEILQLQRIIQDGGASGAKWILEKAMPEKWGSGAVAAKRERVESKGIENRADGGQSQIEFFDDEYEIEL